MKKTKNNLRRIINVSLLIAAVCMSAAFATSCKKGDSGKQQANLLTTASWKTTAREWLTTDGRWVTTPSWASAHYAPTMTFFDTGTYTGTYPNTPNSVSGTWQMSGDKLVLVTSSGSSKTVTVASLTGSMLQLTTPLNGDYIVEGSGTNTKYTYCTADRTTFSH